MRREERVTVQGPVKEQQPDGMSHRGGGGGLGPDLMLVRNEIYRRQNGLGPVLVHRPLGSGPPPLPLFYCTLDARCPVLCVVGDRLCWLRSVLGEREGGGGGARVGPLSRCSLPCALGVPSAPPALTGWHIQSVVAGARRNN